MAVDAYGNELPDPNGFGARAARYLKERIGNAVGRTADVMSAPGAAIRGGLSDFAGEYWPSLTSQPGLGAVPAANRPAGVMPAPTAAPMIPMPPAAPPADTGFQVPDMRATMARERVIQRATQQGTADPASARIRGIAGNPGAMSAFNAEQAANGIPAVASRGATGGLVLSQTPGPAVKRYIGADGTATANWTDTEEFQSATKRAANDKAQLAKIGEDKKIADAKWDMDHAKNPRRLAATTSAYNKLLDTQAAAAQHAATLNLSSQEMYRKALHDQLDFQIRSTTAAASAGKDNAETSSLVERQRLAREYLAAHPGDNTGAAAIIAGRPQTHDNFTFMPNVTGDKVIASNRGTGKSTISSPSEVAKFGKDPKTGKFHLQDAAGKSIREATPEETAQLLKKQ